jgi:integrase
LKKTEKLRGSRGVYKRGDVWLAVVEFPRDQKMGVRRRRWSLGFATRREAEAERDRMRSEIRNGVDVVPKKITVAGYLTRWLAHIEPRVAPRTAASYRGIVEGRLIPTLGGTELSRLTALQVSEAVSLWTTGPRNDGRKGVLSSRSVQLALVVLRMALTQAVKWNVVARNVAEQVDSPRVDRTEQAFVSADDLDRLFVESEKCGMFASVATAVGLGLRRAELLGLQWGDVNFERRTVSITRTLQAGIDLKTVSSNLGHSSVRLTGDTYSHVVSSVGEDAADRIDAVIRGRKRST